MTDFQLVFQAHHETFCTFIFPLHCNLKLICQIEIHITHAPTNFKEVELFVLVLFTCARMKVVSWVIYDLDHHHPTQIYSEYFHFLTIFWIINVVFLIKEELHNLTMEAGWNIAIHLYKQFVNATKRDYEAALVMACYRNNLRAMEMLLKAGTDPNTADHICGHTCLHIACFQGSSKNIFQTLINHGASVNATTSMGVTVLLYACFDKNEDALKVLLDAGADPGKGEPNGSTGLHYAILHGLSGTILENMIDHGVDVNATNGAGQTALIAACVLGKEKAIKILLNSGADPNIADMDGIRCLQYASCTHCSTDTLQALVDHGARANATVDNSQIASSVATFKEVIATMQHDNKTGTIVWPTANIAIDSKDHCYNLLLHHAVMRGCSIEFLQEIVNDGLDINATDVLNQTALMHACRTGNADAINVLLKAGADPNIADCEGNTSLHCTGVGECSKEALLTIIDHGANVNAMNKLDRTALMLALASCKENADVINVLLSAGADLSIADVGGNTSLHAAAGGRCNKEIWQKLINQSADVDIRNNKNQTALMLALSKGNTDAIKVLQNAGAHPDIVDADGNTCLHHAVMGACSKRLCWQSLILVLMSMSPT